MARIRQLYAESAELGSPLQTVEEALTGLVWARVSEGCDVRIKPHSIAHKHGYLVTVDELHEHMDHPVRRSVWFVST